MVSHPAPQEPSRPPVPTFTVTFAPAVAAALSSYRMPPPPPPPPASVPPPPPPPTASTDSAFASFGTVQPPVAVRYERGNVSNVSFSTLPVVLTSSYVGVPYAVSAVFAAADGAEFATVEPLTPLKSYWATRPVALEGVNSCIAVWISPCVRAVDHSRH